MQLWRDLRAWVFTLLLSLFLILIGYIVFGRYGLFFGLAASLIVSYIAFFFDHLSLVRLLHAHPVEGRDPWGIGTSIRHLAKKLNISPQEVLIFHSPVPTAFVEMTGIESGRIAVSDGLIKKLTPAETHAILALGMAHISVRGQVFSVLVERLAKVVIALGQIGDRALFAKNSQIVSRLLYPLAQLHIWVAFPPKKFLLCDSLASGLIPKPATLAEALWKMQNSVYAQKLKTPIGTEHQFLLPSQTDQPVHLQVQKSIEVRLRRLVGYYPI